MEQIRINFESTESDVQGIENAAIALQAQKLNPEDMQTTLSANNNQQVAFTESQMLLVALGEALDKEVINARSIGTEFQQYDQMIADLMDNFGTR